MDSYIVSCFLNGTLEITEYFLQHAFVQYSQITLHFLNKKNAIMFFYRNYTIFHLTFY